MTYIVPILPSAGEQYALRKAISHVIHSGSDLLVIAAFSQDDDPAKIDDALDGISAELDSLELAYRVVAALPREDLVERIRGEVRDPDQDVVVVDVPVQKPDARYHLGEYIRRIIAEVPAHVWVVRGNAASQTRLGE
ncbi:MAG: hypothetical protein PUK40_01915 [Actinomycetaceae bacterium]|nr:hypothetical protein [Arcanobacterium sp.]MDD7504699.1 hypothetical protein [Actinomycetaceae bacterium]MDY6142969.1 hypothetical protein [Arcanobacterium sp.]